MGAGAETGASKRNSGVEAWADETFFTWRSARKGRIGFSTRADFSARGARSAGSAFGAFSALAGFGLFSAFGLRARGALGRRVFLFSPPAAAADERSSDLGVRAMEDSVEIRGEPVRQTHGTRGGFKTDT
jgi:hypothetical protein